METIYSDNQIMLKVKGGDINKLALLYERYKKMLFAYFYKMNQNTSSCEDMVQVVFMKIIHSKHSFTGKGEFTMWMYTIARNVAYDHYRKNSKPHDDINDYENCLSAEVDVEKDLTDLEQIDLLKQALNALKYSQKEVLILSRYKQLKYKQIAEILKVSEGAVKMKIKRALIELKRIYMKIEQGDTNENFI
jgi:RNA polymerase sigma-70 factor (ECF subfamily)